MKTEAEIRVMLLQYKPRNVGGSQKQEESRKYNVLEVSEGA